MRNKRSAVRAASATLGGVATVTALCLGVSAPVGAADPGPPASAITVTHDPGPGRPDCLPARDAATGSTTNTDRYFTVTINATAPICEPVTAVVYSMPPNFFYPWPQDKVEATTIEVEAGVTTVRFTKGCAPVQFDVVTGRTPDRIQPSTGPMHGPLLFDFPPTWSALQWWGSGCGPTTTTTTTTSTTTTTTQPTEVAPTTTINGGTPGDTTMTTLGPDGSDTAGVVPAGTTPPGTDGTEVQGVATTPTSTTSTSPSVVGLPTTGGSPLPNVALSSAFIAAGFGLLRLRRRRTMPAIPVTVGTAPNTRLFGTSSN